MTGQLTNENAPVAVRGELKFADDASLNEEIKRSVHGYTPPAPALR
jgi:hypothetical protein